MLRAIYAFHRFVNGWDDIGYNFVVDLYGRIFEARAGGIDEPVAGAQAGGYNFSSTGVAVLGSFSSVGVSPAALAALERLLAWKLSLHGVPAIGRVLVQGEPCGRRLQPLPRQRHRVAAADRRPPRRRRDRMPRRQPLPGAARRAQARARARGTPHQAHAHARRAAPAGAGCFQPARRERALSGSVSPPAPQAPAGTLAFLDGTPIAGATVLVQMRTLSAKGEVVVEQTVAQAVTGARGEWSAAGAYTPAARRADRAAGALPGRARRLRRERLRTATGGPRGPRQPGARPSAQRSSNPACEWVRPSSGAVRTSSVGASRHAAHAWQSSSSASSIQASGRAPAYVSIASSFQCASEWLLRPPTARAKRRWGRPAGSPEQVG